MRRLRVVAVVFRMGSVHHRCMTEDQAKPKPEDQQPEELSEDDVEGVSGGNNNIKQISLASSQTSDPSFQYPI